MLAGTPKVKRFLDLVQIVLSFVSVCAVVDASRTTSLREDLPGYHSSIPGSRETERDRRFADLARAERKRREAEQLATLGRGGGAARNATRAA